jgi:acetyl-CoA carboxylase carboxyltransferase component
MSIPSLGRMPPGADSEADALYLIRKLLSYLPQNNMEDPPFVPTATTRCAWMSPGYAHPR